eukprot:scaffold159755_cov32-Tisochrysis_lutea.AAC.1
MKANAVPRNFPMLFGFWSIRKQGQHAPFLRQPKPKAQCSRVLGSAYKHIAQEREVARWRPLSWLSSSSTCLCSCATN